MTNPPTPDLTPEAVERLAKYHDWRPAGESKTAATLRALSAALEAEKARAEAAEAERDALKAVLAEAIESAAKVAENCFLLVAPETVSQRVGTESNRAAIAAAIRALKKGPDQ